MGDGRVSNCGTYVFGFIGTTVNATEAQVKLVVTIDMANYKRKIQPNAYVLINPHGDHTRRPVFNSPAVYVPAPAPAPAPPVPTDCPVPGSLPAPLPLPNGNNASRNVIDPTRHKLWIIDESGPNVYIVDIQTFTLETTFDSLSQFGCPCIDYDPINDQMVIMTYDGDMVFVDAGAYTEKGRMAAEVRWPGFHMLAIDKATGTVFASDNRNTFGHLRVIDGATRTRTQYHIYNSMSPAIATDSICWADNVQRLIINRGIGNWFTYFDPVGQTFVASNLIDNVSFAYENFYVPQTGHLLISTNGNSAAGIIDPQTDTQIGTISARRISDACVNTCTNMLYVSDGNSTIYRYDLGNNYAQVGTYSTTPTGLAHSRKTNFVYFESWGDNPIDVQAICDAVVI